MEAPSPVIYGPLDRVEHIMGMPIGIEVHDPEVDPAALDAAFDWFRRVDATFSTYKADSEISRLNRGELTLADAHPDVRAVLARCEELYEETGGYFDIRVPFLRGVIDPSGLVKGWSVERAGEILAEAGARNFAVNAGGDIVVRGHPPEALMWRIGIKHPFEHDRVAAVVGMTDGTVATSATYERGQHIFNPYTAGPPTGVLSVTITGPDLGTADAYATAVFAMGEEGPNWAATLSGYEAMIILDTRTVLTTPGFPRAEDS
jgi:thiamine biosynthesis lipoprotein